MALIPPFSEQHINVVIETARGLGDKYHYHAGWDAFVLKKRLPTGMAFPFDFGFVPNTRAEDGDPVDVLVIMEQPSYPGCIVPCRPLGILEAEQYENQLKQRNDRVVAIAASSVLYGNVMQTSDLGKDFANQVESFFTDYNRQEGKKFIPLHWRGKQAAMDAIYRHCTKQDQ